MCVWCNDNFSEIENKKLNLFTDEEIEAYLQRIFGGLVTEEQLDVDYYIKVARKLMEGVYQGFGKNIVNVQWGTPDYEMLSSLRENVYVFSGAKNYQQTKEISQLLTKGDSFRQFNDFKKEATKIFETYNENYLRAEYNSSIAQARSARNWMEIEREIKEYEQLQYETVGDGRVRLEHEKLDNIIRPVNDKFWDIYYPPNGWNCRCIVIQTTGGVNTPKVNIPKMSEEQVPEIFRFNAGKTKQIFNPAHPYFEVAKKDKDLAKNNFNLPLP